MDDITRLKMGRKASNIALLVNITLMLSKAWIGVIAKSTAITADAFNNGTDIFATIAVFGGLSIAYRPPDKNHHYGHTKAEPIVSKIVAMMVLLTGFSIAWESLRQIIIGKSQAPGTLAIYISAVSIIIKYSLYKYTNRIGKTIENSSIVADSYNHRSDVLASIAAIIGVGGARLGAPILDPAAGLVVSAIILRTGISIYLEAVDALMDTAPKPEILKKITDIAVGTAGVMQVNQLKARKSGPHLYIDLKICVDKNITVEEGHKIAYNTKDNLTSKMDNIRDVMVHVNPCTKIYDGKPDCVNCNERKQIKD